MLTMPTMLITGASSGLGREMAIQLSHRAQLILVSRDISSLEETAAMCKGSPLLLPADISSEADCKRIIEEAIEKMGSLDHIILNAGISMWSSFEDLNDLSIMQKLMHTNYLGAVYCTYYALPYLKKNRGMITVISSIQGKIGVPFHSGYAASKHALEGFFNSLRIEVDRSVDILMVSPGWIKDTQLKKNALGNPSKRNISAKHSKQAVNLNECATEIIGAIVKRKRELIIPKKYILLPWLKLIMPSLVDNLINKRIT